METRTSTSNRIYNSLQQPETIRNLAEALGISEKHVYAVALVPERVLYHSIIASVITRLYIPEMNEKKRGEYIAEAVKKIYDEIQPAFSKRLHHHLPALDKTRRDIREYVGRIDASVHATRHFNTRLFNLMWYLDNYPESWHKRAVETYKSLLQRLGPSPQVAEMTALWTMKNYEFKFYRRLSRDLAEQYIGTHISPDQLLVPVAPTQRKMALFSGGMGSGKSFLTQEWLASLDDTERHSLFLQDSDYLKIALARQAEADGSIPNCDLVDVHDESSNVLYEISRKIAFLAKTGSNVPHVVMNHIEIREDRLNEALAGGGSVEVYHVSIDPADAILATQERVAATGRVVAPAAVHDSIMRSARNLFTLAQYEGANLVVNLYERSRASPVCAGFIDMRNAEAVIYDLRAFKRILVRSELGDTEDQTWEKAVDTLLVRNIGLKVVSATDHEKVAMTLSPERVLTTFDCDDSNAKWNVDTLKPFSHTKPIFPEISAGRPPARLEFP